MTVAAPPDLSASARASLAAARRAGPHVGIAAASFLMREGVASVLRAAGVRVDAVLATGEELLRVMERNAPDVVVLAGDLRKRWDGRTSRDLVRELRQGRPKLALVLLCEESDLDVGLLRHGAAGLAVLSTASLVDGERLVSAVRETTRGGSLLEPAIVNRLLSRHQRRGAREVLTARELDVLALIAAGRNNRAIACGLSLTERAVEKHINSIFRKLGVHHDPELHLRVAAVLRYMALVAGGEGAGRSERLSGVN